MLGCFLFICSETPSRAAAFLLSRSSCRILGLKLSHFASMLIRIVDWVLQNQREAASGGLSVIAMSIFVLSLVFMIHASFFNLLSQSYAVLDGLPLRISVSRDVTAKDENLISNTDIVAFLERTTGMSANDEDVHVIREWVHDLDSFFAEMVDDDELPHCERKSIINRAELERWDVVSFLG